MLTLFHRFLPAYYLLLCAFVGLSLAWLVTSETAITLSAHTTDSPSSAGRAPGLEHNRSPQDNRIILQRNIFDASGPAEAASVARVQPQPTAGQRSVVAGSSMTLIGTVVADEDSLAVIDVNGQIEVVRINQQVPGSGTLVTVEREFIEIKQSDGRIVLLALDSEATAAPATDRTHVRTGTTATTASYEVQSLGNNRWVISSSEAEKARSNIAELIKQVRVDPFVVDGKTEGFIIKRIQRGTLLYQMGLKRGDILFAVNGTSLDSPEKGLQIFQQLREARNLSVDLQRAGQPLNFQYEIK